MLPLRRPTREEAEAAVRTLIRWAGDDPERESLVDTPRRVVEAYEEFFVGYRRDASTCLARIFKDVCGYDGLVLLRDVPFFSHCEHHMMPIPGKAHIGYFPRRGIVGLSKLARTIDVFARRLRTPETLADEIVHAIEENLDPHGIALRLEAEHLCAALYEARGARAALVTTRFTGKFETDPNAQRTFVAMLGAERASGPEAGGSRGGVH